MFTGAAGKPKQQLTVSIKAKLATLDSRKMWGFFYRQPDIHKVRGRKQKQSPVLFYWPRRVSVNQTMALLCKS